MCDELSARLFRPWSNIDSRDHSKQIVQQDDRGDSREIVIACDEEEKKKRCYNIFMISGKAMEDSSSAAETSPNFSSRQWKIDDDRSTENTGDSEFSEQKVTLKGVCPLNDNSSRTAGRIRVQDIADPVCHSMYSCNSFRKFNLPHSTSFDAMMMSACLPNQVGTVYPPWIDITKMQFLSSFQPSYDVQGNLHAEMMDNDIQILQRQAKQTEKRRSKRFRCEHCNVAFSNNGQLKGHVRIHTGERPFKCDVENCGKAFTRNEELTRHKRIHTGLRPHACLVCGKSFGRKDHLKKHMRTHENRDYRLSTATLGMFTPGHILSPQGLLFPHYNFPT